MKKRIAIVTGASGGLGKEFVRQMLSENVDEIWAVARNKEKLEGLRAEWGERIVPFAGDLSSPEGVHALCEKLGEQTPVIVYLVNNAGTGRMEEYEKSSVPEIEKTIYLNSTAVAVLSRACIPYMEPGGHIVNVASQAAFQPLPFMTTYAATKAFVKNFVKKGRDMSVNTFGVKCMHLLAKLSPQRLISKAWLLYIRRYVGK